MASIKTKTISLTEVALKSSDEFPSGTISGLAAHGGNVDAQGERIMPGAFTKTIAAFRKSGRILPLLDSHQIFNGTASVIGRVVELEERKNGSLFFKAFFSASPAAQEVRQKIKERILDSLSIGFLVKDKRLRPDNVLELLEISLREISVTSFPANSLATVSAIKSNGSAGADTAAPTREGIGEQEFNAQLADYAALRMARADEDRLHSYENVFEKW